MRSVSWKKLMEKIIKLFERVVVISLLGLMMLAVLASTIQLVFVLVQELIQQPLMRLNVDEMLKVFGFFLMVLIGLELLETIKAYIEEDRVHAEVVFLVAIVAVSRKVIILDYKQTPTDLLFGMSTLIIALGIGYFLVRRALSYRLREKHLSSNN